jgi:hypothetical protein
MKIGGTVSKDGSKGKGNKWKVSAIALGKKIKSSYGRLKAGGREHV